jgi:hypothetical protein
MKTKTIKSLLYSIAFLLLLSCQKEELAIPKNPDLSINQGGSNSLNTALGLKKLLRYRHYIYRDNIIYTTIARPAGIGPDGYEAAGDLGYVYTKKVSGTVPLYQYHDKLHNADERYFYSIKYLATANNIYFDVDGITYYYEGIVGYVFPSNISGTRPVYRYSWITSSSAHPIFVYTLNTAPLPGYEGIFFYVHN